MYGSCQLDIEIIVISYIFFFLNVDVARKLAKLNAKTSNSESTSTQDALKELAHTKVRPGGSRSSFPKININRP